MFFHDRVTISAPGEIVDYDEYGLPVYGPPTERAFPAQVDPSSSLDGPENNAEQVISRYRVMVKLPADVDPTGIDQVTWQGNTLRVDGRVQPQMIRGRISHHEFVSERATG